MVTSRSEKSVLKEAIQVSELDNFRGTITDLGGPTANLYGVSCEQKSCNRHNCLGNGVCPKLVLDEDRFVSLLQKVQALSKVKHVHVSSGLRMELLLKTPHLLEQLILHNTPGAMKIAPEHTEDEVLRLMHKKPYILPQFLEKCAYIAEKNHRKIRFSPYLMSSHPGCALQDMKKMAAKIKKLGLSVRAYQDFTPTPGTLSTAMYVSGVDRDTGKALYVATGEKDRRMQRMVLEKMSRNKKTK